MPLDDALPPSRLPLDPARGQIVAHFQTAYGVRVDWHDMTRTERLGLAGARLPEPPEAHLLDRVLQVVPPFLLRTVQRILIVDNGTVGRFGGYLAGIVRLYSPALRLTAADPNFGGRFSYFTTTVLHEIGHAVYSEALGDEQRQRVVDLYLAELIATADTDDALVEPSDAGAEQYFVALLTSALLRVRGARQRPEQARTHIRSLGLPLE